MLFLRDYWTARRINRRRGRRFPRSLEALEGRALLTSASFSLTGDWGTGFGGQIAITSTNPNPINNWNLAFDWDRAITDIWNARVVSHVGNHYVIASADWNATITPGSTVGFGFNGAPGNVGTDVPTHYALNGVALGTAALPSLSINDVSVNDGAAGATAVFAVKLSQSSTNPVTVKYATADGSAHAGTDYKATSGTLTFQPGTLTQSISVPILPDTTAKPNLTFQVKLSGASSATIAAASATGTIIDTIPPPKASAAASFQVTDDWGTGFGGQITITNNQAAAISNWTLAFTWDRTITQIWNASITSHTGNQYVITNAGWNATIPGNGSVQFGFNGTSGNVGTDIPTNYVLNGVALGASVPSLSINNVSVNDGASGATAIFTVKLSQPSASNVTVNYATADGSAHAGADYSATSGSLTFKPGTTSLTISVPIAPETTAKPNETFQVKLSGAVGANIATVSGTGTIVDVTVTASNWPAHVFAPYVDMANYPTYSLQTAMTQAGLKFFTLAFITADSNKAPAWGGYTEYEVNGGTFDQGIRAQVNQVRAQGGDVSVSFGGENGQELAQAITNVTTLTAAYQQVINAYNLTHIDFDIEGGAVADHASIDRRSQAIAALQQAAAKAGKALDVSFTLPVLPAGLTADGLYVLQSALKYGVKINLVNVMAMDYGDSAAPNPAGEMGTYAIDSAQSTFNQVKSLYGSTLTDAQLWAMIGVTPLIGVNDVADEIFKPDDAKQLLAFAQKVGLGELSFWSLLRDQEDPRGALLYSEYNSSSIVQTPFEFAIIFKPFTSS